MKKLIFFKGEECPACDILKPIVKRLCEKKRISFYELDATDEIELAQRYGVSILPTIVFNEESLEGYQEEEDIIEFLAIA